ncbi:hypothetical protein HK099_001322 [Clydaea vesicula]|uniref:Succinylglutamate desuccinylase/Aspartoacylase catalytic domain-containing protein n=1 Tax=Clydaea vesicula TaxID=447962 RepID=A0AAD5U565_9FUNG|nr:hypothetical protein HK099_001322 [Clydaea vesicula]
MTEFHPKTRHISNYPKQPWKNGLGVTYHILIHPSSKDFNSDNFIWRFVRSQADHDCSFSVLPGFEVVLLQLPSENVDLKNLRSFPVLRHNDQENLISWKPLVPYTYDGEWLTTCRKLAEVTVALETICSIGSGVDGNLERDGDGDFVDSQENEKDIAANPTTKILLGNFTIVYVVKGAINVQIEQEESTRYVAEGETLIIERDEESEPTDFAMTPVASKNNLFEASENEERTLKRHGRAISAGLNVPFDRSAKSEDATVFVIQINLKIERKMSSSWDIPLFPPPVHRGSIIIYDDQPFQPISETEPNIAEGTSIANSLKAKLSTQYWESASHYRPPVFSARYVNESEVPPPIVRDSLVIEEFPARKISTCWINMVKQGLSEWIKVPIIIARGVEEGPVVGITAVVHGNELNGVPCIHRVITDIDVNRLKGTVVAVPCVNVPGYLRFSREFSDGKDLNRLFPGQEFGTASQIYAFNLLSKIVERFNILIDLHTASFGRVNSYYVRSDMNDSGSAVLAKLQQPQIILHNSGQDGMFFFKNLIFENMLGTLRSAASARGIKAITVEIGNPQLFQNQYVQWSYMGVMSILSYLGMFSSASPTWPPEVTEELMKIASAGEGKTDPFLSTKSFPAMPAPSTIICSKGFWIYTKTGGVLEVYPGVNTVIRKGAMIARIKNIFGNIVETIFSPASGIV